MRKTFYRLFLITVVIDLGYAFDYLYRPASPLSMFLHGFVVALYLICFAAAAGAANLKQKDSYRTLNFWLLTLCLPAVIGYVLMFAMYRLGLVPGHAFDSDAQVFQTGLLFGTLFLIPQIGTLVGWKMLRDLFKE